MLWGKGAFTFRKGFSILACPCARTVREHPRKGDNKMKKPRLTDADRLAIETGLRSGKTVYCIAKELSRPVTTVTREIRARAVESDKGAAYRVTNRCAFRMECGRRGVCAHCLYDGRRQCRFCRQCNSHCPAFVEQKCARLDNPPFVCNGCADERRCVLRKRYYLHGKAQENYETILSESRTGANVTEGELLAFDALLRDLTAKGQSVHAAMASNPDRFTVSEKTVYRYINGGLLSTKRGSLPRACMVKPRKGKGVEHRVDRTCRVGRTWEDYLAFVEGNPGVRVVEMDTVEGARGGKALLTLIFNPFSFMLAFLIDAKTSECVLGVFASIVDALKKRCGDGWREMFARLFPVILTDNGSEFSNPSAIESDNGGRLTSVFYCKAYASYQKPHVGAQPRVHPPRAAQGDRVHRADILRRPHSRHGVPDDVARQLIRSRRPRRQDALRPLRRGVRGGRRGALRNRPRRGERRHAQAVAAGHRGQGEGERLAERCRDIRKEVADGP